jgi:hypothetical protein
MKSQGVLKIGKLEVFMDGTLAFICSIANF